MNIQSKIILLKLNVHKLDVIEMLIFCKKTTKKTIVLGLTNGRHLGQYHITTFGGNSNQGKVGITAGNRTQALAIDPQTLYH